MQKITRNTITAICFLVMMGGAFLLNAITPDRSFSEHENRMLQELPTLDYDQYLDGRYETKFEKYANDQFVFRDGFIRVKTSFDVARGVVESNGVYRGKDNYLIEKVTVPTKRRIKADKKALKAFKSRNKNLNMNFMLVPTAGSILSDKLPGAVPMPDQNEYIDSFFAKLEKMDYNVIDVRDRFNERKDKVQLYYRTDHHWTTDGAYEAYKVLVPELGMKKTLKYRPLIVKDDFMGTLYSKSGFANGLSDEIKIYMPKGKKSFNSVIDFQDDSDKTTEFYNLDNLDSKDAYAVFGGGNHPVYSIRTPVKESKRLLIIKDSYANCMIPLLTQYYREIVVVDPRYYFENLDDLIQVENITDVLFLYNADTFFADDDLAMMLSE